MSWKYVVIATVFVPVSFKSSLHVIKERHN